MSQALPLQDSTSSSRCSVMPWRRRSFTRSSGASTSFVNASNTSTLQWRQQHRFRYKLFSLMKCSISTLQLPRQQRTSNQVVLTVACVTSIDDRPGGCT